MTIDELNKALDRMCGKGWYYVGGFAALIWFTAAGKLAVETDCLDIVIANMLNYMRVKKAFLNPDDKKRTFGGYRVQFIYIPFPRNIYRLKSFNLLSPADIIKSYNFTEAETSPEKRAKRIKRINMLKNIDPVKYSCLIGR